MFAVFCLVILSSSANAVINQEAQRREAPHGLLEVPPPPPNSPQKEYGTPIQRPQQNYGPPLNQRRLQAMQRLIAAMRSKQAGGYASQGRVVNRPAPRPIPLQKPQNNYGPPQNSYGPPQQQQQHVSAGGHSSGSTSLQAFTHSHTPGVSCEGWIPIPGPSVGTANSANVDTSYGVPSTGSGHASQGTLIVVPEETYGVPQNNYGPPQISSSGHSSSGHSSSGHSNSIDSSYGVPAPPSNPQNNYGPPQISSSGHSSSGHSASIDTSYGVPPPPTNPQNSYGPPQGSSSGHSSSGHSSSGHSIDSSYGVPAPPSRPQNNYGPPQISSSGHSSSGHSHSIDSSYGPPSRPQNSYGPPQISSSGHSSSGHSHSIDSSYGVPSQPSAPQNTYGPPASGQGHSSSSSIGAIDTSYGIPEAPSPQPQVPHKEYGVPSHFSSGGSAHSIQQPDIPVRPLEPIAPHVEYGAPEIITHESANQHSSAGGSYSIEQNFGPSPSANIPHNEYGPPVIVGSGHASSATAIEQSYGAPVQQISHQPAPVSEYGAPHNSVSSGHASSFNSFENQQQQGHQTYGIPAQQPNVPDFGPPESSYGPPPSGAIHQEEVRHGHAANIQELQVPEVNSNIPFSNDISVGISALGVSSGNSEVIQSHAIHESHTSEVTQNHNSNIGDTYSAPPLDSYAPGKYAPSFMTRRPSIIPTPPARRPFIPQAQRQQYIPPIPSKINRPQQHPPPNFRPLSQNGHAHSIAQSYSSHSQSAHSQGAIRQQAPRQPLVYRPPVPQGLIQSIGNQVQAQDNGQRVQTVNTYLPPPTNELPIPPMRLVVPYSGPVQPFQTQSHHSHQQSHQSGSGVATSSSSFSLQNQDLRHVHVIHDCGKGPQLSQNYGPPQQSYGAPDSHSAVLSAGYSIPAQNLEIPQHNSANFQQPQNTYGVPSDSYGPPASGPASLDVIGLDPRSNHNSELHTAESSNVAQTLPGLNGGLGDSGLDFISAHKSHTLVLPKNQGSASDFKFHIQGSHSENSDNRVDGPDHQQILADGLLQSILSAIEQKPGPQAVPQVSEDVESEHKDAKFFLTSREGQEVLADKNGNVESAH